jgi:uncharacterized protein YyaL (SSP411 family)
MMLSALSIYHAGLRQVVVTGRDDADIAPLLKAVGRHYQPASVVVPVGAVARASLERVLPWLEPMTARDGQATAYVCRDFACQVPVHTPEALTAQLQDRQSR